MAWSYNPADLATSKKDAVRYLVRDTNENDPLIEDEEITFTLSEEGQNIYRAAAQVCLTIAAELGRQLSLKGKVALDAKEQHDNYMKLAAKYERKAATGAAPFAGGISVADKSTRERDADRTPAGFTRDLHSAAGNDSLTDF
jgi:hypothetical protein